MKVNYTRHAEDKLERTDIKRFKVSKKLIEDSLSKSKHKNRTKYGEFFYLVRVSAKHDLRIIYDIIEDSIKVITFHIARKGRYET